MDAKTLVLIVGLPLSGKSTWAAMHGAPVVCPDAIRLALHGERFVALAEPFVWAIAKVMVRALFLAGHREVVLDACNVTRARRDEWKSSRWDRQFFTLEPGVDECLRRAEAAGDEEIVPVIEAMALKYEPVEGDEC